jgi:hypothetical protein
VRAKESEIREYGAREIRARESENEKREKREKREKKERRKREERERMWIFFLLVISFQNSFLSIRLKTET